MKFFDEIKTIRECWWPFLNGLLALPLSLVCGLVGFSFLGWSNGFGGLVGILVTILVFFCWLAILGRKKRAFLIGSITVPILCGLFVGALAVVVPNVEKSWQVTEGAVIKAGPLVLLNHSYPMPDGIGGLVRQKVDYKYKPVGSFYTIVSSEVLSERTVSDLEKCYYEGNKILIWYDSKNFFRSQLDPNACMQLDFELGIPK